MYWVNHSLFCEGHLKRRSMATWGNGAWCFMHRATFAFPDNPTSEQQGLAKAFFTSLGVMLPCPRCREDWEGLMRDHPVQVGSRDEVSKWLWARHNDVNRRLGKHCLTWKQARVKFDDEFRKRRATMQVGKVLAYGVVVAILLFFGVSLAVQVSCGECS